MRPGDYAAIVKFNNTNPNRASVVQPFTQIDGGVGNAALNAAVDASYIGEGSNILDGTLLSVQQFTAPTVTLPNGPKAVILVSDGDENSSDADFNEVVQAANDAKIAVFTVGVGDFASTTSQEILPGLASQTAATFYPAPTSEQIGDAYVSVSTLLSNEYLLSFTSSLPGLPSCPVHTLEVQVAGLGSSGVQTFTRCTLLFAPDVRGLTQAAAEAELNALGLVVSNNVTQQSSASVPAGSVISQNPTVGTVMTAGAAVELVVSSGPAPAPSAGGGATDPFELIAGIVLVALLGLRRFTKA
jgi:hypothetical protein